MARLLHFPVSVAAMLVAGMGMAAAQTCAPHSAPQTAACIDAQSLWHHLSAFQAIADAHPDARGHGNRDTGTAGYRASVAYVDKLMRAAGYAVTVQSYKLPASALTARPAFAAAGRQMTYGTEYLVASLSGSGHVSARVAASGDGCSTAAFARFPRGQIALLPRAACDFTAQVENAEAAGASGVILYDAAESDAARPTARAGAGSMTGGEATQARLVRPAQVPVIGVISAAAAARVLSSETPSASISVDTAVRWIEDYNLIADSPYGDANHTVVIEGHLDSIYGAGMLDNASGSVSILDTALALATTPTRNHLRYIWFGGEELGLFGSSYYTTHLPADALKQIVFDVDADVTATPNFDVLIADPAYAANVRKFPPNVVPGSKPGNEAFLRYFAAAGIAAFPAGFGNDGTDSNSFSLVGVPNTGVLTNQDCCKGKNEVKTWGGFLGNYEGKVPGFNGGCVDWPGRWCDNLPNNDRFVFTFMSKAVAYVTYELANDSRL